MKKRFKPCVGDWLQLLISIITLGKGKVIATWISHKLGYADCGCNGRQERINNYFGCYKDIKL